MHWKTRPFDVLFGASLESLPLSVFISDSSMLSSDVPGSDFVGLADDDITGSSDTGRASAVPDKLSSFANDI